MKASRFQNFNLNEDKIAFNLNLVSELAPLRRGAKALVLDKKLSGPLTQIVQISALKVHSSLAFARQSSPLKGDRTWPSSDAKVALRAGDYAA